MISALDIWQHRPRLLRYARTLTVTRDQAEDLVSDAILRAIEKRHLFRDDVNLLGWLMKLMHNIKINQVRTARRDFTYKGAVLHFGSRSAEPSQFHARRLAETIAGISLLNEDQQQAVWLLADGMSRSAAAKIAGVPVGTTISRAYRARQFLKAREAA